MEGTLSANRSIAKIAAIKTCGQYFLAMFLSMILSCFVLQIWSLKHLFYCVDYSGDGLFYAMAIKSMITSGWYLDNSFIGVPDGYSLADFPLSDGLNFLLIKFLTCFSSNWIFVQNAFFILTFPLTALIALFVFKQLNLKYPFALTGSLLYSLLPYHFIRSTHHLLLSAYFIVPLAIWLAVLIYQNKLFEEDNVFSVVNKNKIMVYAFVCLLIGSTGIYYAYFGCFFILVAGLIASYTRKKSHPRLNALLLIFAICISVIINIWPTISYQIHHGKNSETAYRSPVDSERYGLKISHLLLPIDDDRISLIAKCKNLYNMAAPLNNENKWASLGIVGSLGFLVLIGRIFLRREKEVEGQNINKDALSHFLLAGLLLATIGGFSTFIGLAMPGIRAYNRISVYLAFFAIAALLISLQDIIKRYGLNENKKVIWSLSLVVLAVGIFSQTSRSYGLENERQTVDQQYKNDKAFVEQIEAVMPKYSMIFQLPYVPFPESPPVCNVFSYDHFRQPLCSNTLRWSFGAIRGREIDKWQKATASNLIPKMVDELVRKGFNGIYIKRLGYKDRAAKVEKQLSDLLKVSPFVANNESFWDLRPYATHLKTQISQQRKSKE